MIKSLVAIGISSFHKMLTSSLTLLMRTVFGISSNEFEFIVPKAVYAPWNKGDDFSKVYQKIKKNTHVDKYRCYELWSLTEQVLKLKEGDFIEIGVWRGGSGALVAKKVELSGQDSKVYLCDTFEGIVKKSDMDTHYANGDYSDTSKEIVMDLINTLEIKNVEILKGIFPDYTSHLLEDKKFRYCHIDVDVYKSAEDIVDWIWDKMVPGGVMVYDDYGFYTCEGIRKHIDKQMKKKDRLILHNLNGHAVVIKLFN